jgi:hypothetical protein
MTVALGSGDPYPVIQPRSIRIAIRIDRIRDPITFETPIIMSTDCRFTSGSQTKGVLRQLA